VTDISQGIIVGVSAGVVTSAILGIRSWLFRWRARREQVRHIRHLVATHMQTILQAAALPPPVQGEKGIPADIVRFSYFRAFQAQLDATVSHRASALSYTETYSLQEITKTTSKTMTDLTLQERKVLPLPMAESMWHCFRDLEWLDLPKKVS